MLYLNNPLFTEDGISSELKKLLNGKIPNPKDPKVIKGFKYKLTRMYFPEMSIDKINAEIETQRFAEFPKLQFVLRQIFANEELPGDIVIPLELDDWKPPAFHYTHNTFQDLNSKYGYFSDNPAEGGIFFDRLQPLCRKMTQLVERQADDNEMAYKLMALFCESKDFLAPDTCLKKISECFVKVSAPFEYKKNHPYHDAFVTELNPFPSAKDAKNIQQWRDFILKAGFPGLTVFADCNSFKSVPTTLKEAQTAQLAKSYPRAAKDIEFAEFCKSHLIDNDGFESGLEFISAGWPTKIVDNLPDVGDIKHNVGSYEYRWVKLPQGDKRALYLGKMTSCCQFINGDSRQCVIDGISLSDNGFYVLLKKKIKKQEPSQKDEASDLLDGEIVAQSYAWISTNGNLCLDSLEWNQARVSEEILKTLMSKFADEVLKQNPQIKYVNVGTGGHTPRQFSPTALLSETQRQGTAYGDSKSQYCIQSKLNLDETNRLGEIPEFYGLDGTLQKKIRYLSAYWESKDLSAETITSMSNLLKTCFFHPFPPIPQELTTADFQSLTFEQYQTLSDVKRQSISTFCKLLNCESLDGFMKWFPTIPPQECLNILVSSNPFWQTVLHTAAQQPKFLQIILQHLQPKDRLSAVQTKDSSGNTVLHRATSNPDSLKIILDLIPKEDRLAALQTKDSSGNTVLHLVASNPDSMKIILQHLPSKDRLAGLQVKVKYEQTVLHLATSNPDSLKIILDHITEEEGLSAVQVKDRDEQTVLHLATSNPDSLKIILDQIPEKDRLAAIQVKNIYEQTVLHRAATNPDSLKMILDQIPEKDRLAAVQVKGDYEQTTVLHLAARNPDSLKMILQSLPPKERLTAVQTKDTEGEIVLNAAANNPDFLKIILDLIAEEDRLAAVQTKDTEGKTVLNAAANNPKSFKAILEIYPPEHRLEAVKAIDQTVGSVVLHLARLAASSPDHLKIILELIPKDVRLAALQTKDSYGSTVLYRMSGDPDYLKKILDLIAEEDRLSALQTKDSSGGTVLHRAANNSDSMKIIFALLPKQDRLTAVQTKDTEGKTVLNAAANNPKSFKEILEIYPPEHRLEAVIEAAKEGKTVLHDVAWSTEYLGIILALLPEQAHLEAVKVADNEGKTVLHAAARSAESLKAILEIYPPEARLEAVKAADNEGKTVLHAAAWSTDSLKAILEIYPPEHRLEAVKATDKEGETVLHTAARALSYCPDRLEAILKCLSPEDRLEVVRAAYSDVKTVHDIFKKYSGSFLTTLDYRTKNDSPSPVSASSIFNSLKDPEKETISSSATKKLGK